MSSKHRYDITTSQDSAVTIVSTDEKPFIWESVSVHFDVWVFLRQCLVHSFIPLTIPFSPNPYVQFFAFRSDYTWRQILFILFFVLVFNSLTQVSIVMYILISIYEPDNSTRYLGSLIFPLLYSSLWRLSIAVRHASFSKNEYKKLMSARDYKTINTYLNQTITNRNYIDSQESDVTEFEIIAGGLRNGFNVYHFNFTIPNADDSCQNFNDWKSFLTKYSFCTDDADLLIEQTDGTFVFSIAVLCKCINNYSQIAAASELSLLNRVLVCIFIFLLVASPFYDIATTRHQDIGNSQLTLAFIVLSSFEMSFFFATVVGRFLFGAIVDMRRQAIVAECFASLIRTNDHVDKMLVDWSPPWSRSTNRHSRHEHLATNHSKMAVNIFQHNVSRKEETVTNKSNTNSNDDNVNCKFKNYLANIYRPSTVFESTLQREYYAFGTAGDDEKDAITIPRISLLFPENLFQWAQARLAMQSLKLRFRKRIEITTVLMLLATFGLYLFILVLIFSKESKALRLETFSTPLFWQTAFSIAAMAVFLILYSYEASYVDEGYNKHRLILAEHAFQINEEQEYITAKIQEFSNPIDEDDKLTCDANSTVLKQELKTLKRISVTIDSISHLLKVKADVKPTEVFGFKADLSLTLGLVSALLSLFGLRISVYLSLREGVRTTVA